MVAVVAIIFIILFRETIKALLLRVVKIGFPGGIDVSIPQKVKPASEENPPPKLDNSSPIKNLPDGLNPEQSKSVEQLIKLHKANTYLWEYRYLNLYLVSSTQKVLDWLISYQETITFALYDSVWLPDIPSANERGVIINVLQSHHLIQIQDNSLIQVTPKGHEYQKWRGPFPTPTSRSTGNL